MFDSSYELIYYIWAKDHNLDIQRCTTSYDYVANGKIHKYFPDFLVDGCTVEIKGEHFLNEQGDLINPYTSDVLIQEEYRQKGLCMKANNVKVITDVS